MQRLYFGLQVIECRAVFGQEISAQQVVVLIGIDFEVEETALRCNVSLLACRYSCSSRIAWAEILA